MVDVGAITQNVISNLGGFGLATNLFLINPKVNRGIEPKGKPNNRFRFHIVGEEVAELSSEITDHYIENNSTIQDNIAIKPLIFTINGEIAELNNVPPAFLEPIQEVADKLTVLSPFIPVQSASAIIAYNQAFQVYQTAERAVQAAESIWDTVVGAGSQNRQQVAFTTLFNYWKQKTLFVVQSPWAVHDNMVIQRLRAVQDDETRMITGFQITFKQLNFASTVTEFEVLPGQGRYNYQSAPEVDFGNTTGTETARSLNSIIGGLA